MRKNALLVLLVGLFLAASASIAVSASSQGKDTQLADFKLQITQDWSQADWTKNGNKIGWRLRYQPGGIDVSQSTLSISLAAEPKTGASKDDVYARQVEILREIKQSFANGFAVQNMDIRGERTLVLRYYDDGNTIFIVLPHTPTKLYDIYVWNKGKAESMPQPAKDLLAGMSLSPGAAPAPEEPEEAVIVETTAAPTAQPVDEANPAATAAPTVAPKPETPAMQGSPVKNACYMAADAGSGNVVTLKMGMSLADVEAKYQVVPQSSSTSENGKYRVWQAKIPCLAYYRYAFSSVRGVEKEKDFAAMTFDVDETKPDKPITRIVAKIICQEGLDASKEIFGWYAQTYGPPAKEVNKMDGITKFGSMEMPNVFWRIWDIQGTGGAPAKMSMKVSRRNDFAYYTIDLDSKVQ